MKDRRHRPNALLLLLLIIQDGVVYVVLNSVDHAKLNATLGVVHSLNPRRNLRRLDERNQRFALPQNLSTQRE